MPSHSVGFLKTAREVGTRLLTLRVRKPRLRKVNALSKITQQVAPMSAGRQEGGSPKSESLAQSPPQDSSTWESPDQPYKPKGRVASLGAGQTL